MPILQTALFFAQCLPMSRSYLLVVLYFYIRPSLTKCFILILCAYWLKSNTSAQCVQIQISLNLKKLSGATLHIIIKTLVN